MSGPPQRPPPKPSGTGGGPPQRAPPKPDRNGPPPPLPKRDLPVKQENQENQEIVPIQSERSGPPRPKRELPQPPVNQEKQETQEIVQIQEHIPEEENNLSTDTPQIEQEVPQVVEVVPEKKEETEEETRSRFRGLVIHELVETEETYVEDLSLILLMFVYPIRSTAIMTMEEQVHLFSNIELVQDANKDILADMHKLKQQSPLEAMVGKMFSKRVEYFVQVYTHYCLNQTTSMSTFESLMKKNSKFKAFVEKMLQDSRCKQLDMMSFLVKPVQRVCKYPLLLREMLKYTPEEHQDYQDLVIAMDKMNGLLAIVNQSSRESRNLEMIMQVEASLTGANHVKLIIPGRKFIRSGKLTKISGKNVQERQFFLFNDMIIYARPLIVKNKQYEFKGLIPLNLLFFRDLPDTDSLKNAIELWRIDLKKKYIVYSDDPETKAEWMKDFEQQKAEQEESEKKKKEKEEKSSTNNVAFQMGKDTDKGKNSLKMAELESRIVGFKSFAKSGKKFLKEGAFTIDENAQNTPKSRYAFLFDDILLITKKSSEKVKKGFQVKGDIPIEKGNILVVNLDDSSTVKNAFSIIRMDNKSKYVISCPDEQAKQDWLTTLQNLSGVVSTGENISSSLNNSSSNLNTSPNANSNTNGPTLHSAILSPTMTRNATPPRAGPSATPPRAGPIATPPRGPSRANSATSVDTRRTTMIGDMNFMKSLAEKLNTDPNTPSPLPSNQAPNKNILKTSGGGGGGVRHSSHSSSAGNLFTQMNNNSNVNNSNNAITNSPGGKDSSRTCHSCQKPFNLQRPKKLCSNCNQTFCVVCSSKKRPLPSKNITTPVRVCDKCFITS